MKFDLRLHCGMVGALGCMLLAGIACAAPDQTPEQLFTANRFPQARTAFQQAIRKEPGQAALHVGLIRTLIRLDRWQEALQEAQSAVVSFPGDADTHAMLSLALMRAGQPDRAATAAQRARELNPESYWTLIATGRIQVWDFQREAARATLHRAVTLHPDWPEAWGLLVDASGDEVSEENLKDTVVYAGLAPKGHPHDLPMETLTTRLNFLRNFLGDQPYHAVSPITEDQMKAAEQGKTPDISFTVPIQRQGEYVILPIQVGEQNLRTLFDTGGGFELTLDRKATARLKLHTLFRSSVRGVSGKENSFLYKAPQMRVGPQVYQAIPVEGINNEVGPFDGIFGVTNFDHSAVTIDFQHNTLTLARGKTATAPPAAPGDRLLVLPFHYYGGDIFVPVEVEGRSVWAIVDTGADAYAIFSLSLAREIAAGRKKDAAKEFHMQGRLGIGTSDTKQTVLTLTDSVSLGIANTAGPSFRTGITPAFGATPLDEQVSPAADFEVGALLGISFLSSAHRITIDYPHRLLTLEFPAAKLARSASRE